MYEGHPINSGVFPMLNIYAEFLYQEATKLVVHTAQYPIFFIPMGTVQCLATNDSRQQNPSRAS